MTQLKAWLAWESITLFMICFVDMCSTLYWVHNHTATEANPLMAYWLHQGDWAFCIAKLLSFVPFLALCAYYRSSRPKLIAVALRSTIVLYATTY
jgi:hypothetical protein